MTRAGKFLVLGWASLVPAQVVPVEAGETVAANAYIRASGDATGKSWERVLVGSLTDPTGYFARNISGLDDTEPGADGVGTVLWTFTHEELGEPRGQPRVALTNALDHEGSGEWAVLFGAGYKGGTGAAALFILFIDRGMDGWTSGDFVEVETGASGLVMPGSGPVPPNGLGEAALVDVDLDGTTDLAYAGDLSGNLFRFDLADSDPSKWHAVRLFQAAYGERAATGQPITQRPYAVAHPMGRGFLVVFATGSEHTGRGRDAAAVQSIYGIWDTGEDEPVTAGFGARGDRLIERTVVNVVDESSGRFSWRRILTGGAVNYAPDAPGRIGVYGWYIDLDMPRAERTLQGNRNPDACGLAPPEPQYPGERAWGRLVPRGDTLFIATVIPRGAQGCSTAPSGSLLAVELITGSSPRRPMIDANDDGRIGSGDVVVFQGDSHSPGIVFPSSEFPGAPGHPVRSSNDDDTAMLTVGDGDDPISLQVGRTGSAGTGRLSWRELQEPM